MLKRVLAGAALAGVAALLYVTLPDIKRYLRMRSM
ncbi:MULTISPECIES: DUF6893 family small protein [unclassified Streptosporangium]